VDNRIQIINAREDPGGYDAACDTIPLTYKTPFRILQLSI